MKSLYAADIHENQLVDSLFLVSSKNHGVTKGGNSYLVLKLLDRSGEIEGRVWDRADDLGRGFDRNDFVRVRGQATLYQGKVQIRVQDVMRVEEKNIAAEDFLPKSPFDPDVMLGELQTILRGMKNPHLLALAEACFADQELMDLIKRAPGAKTIHHPYLSGLLEHTLSLLKLILRVVENYQGIDVDLLLTGGFLHDIGKVYEFSFERAVEYTDAGQLLGHLVMEVEMVNKKIATIPDFPDELAMLVKHLLVSHHGAYEFGSPKLPQTVEAIMLHALDDLDGKIQAVQNLPEKEPGSKWTVFHRAYGRSFYRGGRENGND
ncbi:MAG: HD domain-containing protein [Deltaproteobacteria bacterium]|nr:HD domain-containing protein [Deltaproteobacteria bacterium]MBI2534305.1 HD domain-containing protein [Deltaproteobacteria bacterium]